MKIIRTLDDARSHIRARTDFQTRTRVTPYGTFTSMSGRKPLAHTGYQPSERIPLPGARIDAGVLPDEYLSSFHLADYAVFSYDTPIAWHHNRPHDLTPELVEQWLDGDSGDGVWIMPTVKYTVTTTSHQGEVTRALGGWARPWAGVEGAPSLPVVDFTIPGAPAKVEHVSVERTWF